MVGHGVYSTCWHTIVNSGAGIVKKSQGWLIIIIDVGNGESTGLFGGLMLGGWAPRQMSCMLVGPLDGWNSWVSMFSQSPTLQRESDIRRLCPRIGPQSRSGYLSDIRTFGSQPGFPRRAMERSCCPYVCSPVEGSLGSLPATRETSSLW